jgi:flagellar hook-associated protein 3 FlgL
MIYDAGVSGINRQTATLLHTQQQISADKRILTPSDDPVAAARALEVQQNIDALSQFKRNQDAATSALSLEDAQLGGANDLLLSVRTLAVQAGNTGLSASQRANIAMELRGDYQQLLGIANAADGNGQSMFSGYMGGVTPFGGAVDNLIAALTGQRPRDCVNPEVLLSQ